MRTLPDSPSLDHLRQQAKDLLQQMRVAELTATLSDAQTVVAEQYGYRTWPDLKAEVDRRCAAVRTTDASVTAAVAAAFDLGNPQGRLLAHERQWAGQAWVLTTDSGRWLARQLFDWFDESAVEAEVRLAEAAAAAGIRTPRPVRSPAGNVIERIDGARWRVFDFVAAGPEPSPPTDPRHAAAAGRILAKVHNLRLPSPETVQPWLTSVREESAWWNLHAVCQARNAPWVDRLAEVIPSIVEACEIIEPAEAAGEVVLSGCHYATNAFRVVGAGDLMVTGFDHAGAIPVRWDLGGTLAAWSGGVGGQLNVAALRALHAGYAEERPLPQPLDLGIFSAALCASMNWLVSRIRIATNPQEDAESRGIATRAVPTLLVTPPSRERFQRIVDALD